MAGANISEARAKQLKTITKSRKRKKIPLPKNIQTEFERVRKIWNKRFKAKGGKPHPQGYFLKGRIEYAYDAYFSGWLYCGSCYSIFIWNYAWCR